MIGRIGLAVVVGEAAQNGDQRRRPVGGGGEEACHQFWSLGRMEFLLQLLVHLEVMGEEWGGYFTYKLLKFFYL